MKLTTFTISPFDTYSVGVWKDEDGSIKLKPDLSNILVDLDTLRKVRDLLTLAIDYGEYHRSNDATTSKTKTKG